MKFDILRFSTLPNPKDKFWQVVLLPTVSVYSNTSQEKHYSINLEWLFWTMTFLIFKED